MSCGPLRLPHPTVPALNQVRSHPLFPIPVHRTNDPDVLPSGLIHLFTAFCYLFCPGATLHSRQLIRVSG
jgi:hypothetical protein